jgi:hypothetical protein
VNDRVVRTLRAIEAEVDRRDSEEPPDPRFDAIIDAVLDFADELENDD